MANLMAAMRIPIRFERGSVALRPSLKQRRGLRTLRHILAAGCAGLAVFFALSALTHSARTRPVVMTSHHLSRGHRITAGDIAVRQLPSNVLQHATFSKISQVVGSITQIEVERNSPLLTGSIASIPRVPDGATVLDIRLTGVVRAIAPGEEIMLVAVTPCARTSCDEASSVLVERALVMDAPKTSKTTSGVTLPCAIDHQLVAKILAAQENAAIMAVARSTSNSP